MKIFFVGRYCESEILSGPEKVAKRIFSEHTKKHSSVFLEYFFDGSKYNYFQKLFGKEFVCNVNNSKVIRMGIFRMFLFLFRSNPDILHLITFERFQVIVLLYAFFFRKKIVYNVHGIACHEEKEFYGRKGFILGYIKFVEKRIIKSSHKILYLSEDSLNILKKYYCFAIDKANIISNGIDEIFYLTSRNRMHNSSNNLNIVFTSDIYRVEKGFNYFLEVLKKISVPVKVHLLGQKSKNLKINVENNNVEFIIKENLTTIEFAEYLLALDVVVSTSYYEPFSISSAECSAAGLLPVLTKETGFSRYITNDSDGFIINYNDIDELKSIIERLYSDIELRESFKLKSMEIYTKLNWRNVYYEYENVYKSLKI